MGAQAGPSKPEDGATGIGPGKLALEWIAGQAAAEHRVYLGTAADNLALVGATNTTRMDAPPLKPDTHYFWRVDEAQADGRVVTGRVACFGTSGLVAWWKLNETEGTKAEDATGHQFAGRVVGSANWAPEGGRIGGAMEFNGRNTLINCGKAPEFGFREAMTVAAWIKVREFNQTWQPIVTKGDNAWRLQRQRDTGMVTFSFNADAGAERGDAKVVSLVSKRKVDDGQWHHVVGVSDGRRAALYVDGELADSADAKPIAQNGSAVMIGCNQAARERKFNGWIDDVRLYAYGLSEGEVKTLYRGGGEASRAEK